MGLCHLNSFYLFFFFKVKSPSLPGGRNESVVGSQDQRSVQEESCHYPTPTVRAFCRVSSGAAVRAEACIKHVR